MKTPTLQQRRFLMVLPAFILIILLSGFYFIKKKEVPKEVVSGLNTTVPDAQFDAHEKPADKMSFYERAERDSGAHHTEPPVYNSPDPNVEQINARLATIHSQISLPPPVVAPVPVKPVPADPQIEAQVSKLEALMQQMNSDKGNDPEMAQLTKMLEQLQAIQNPKKETVAAVTESPFKAIPATLDGKQKVLQGSAIKIRLTDTVRLREQVIPAGTLVFGICSITNQRLLVDIKNIRLGEAIIPVDLTVYSLDGMPGIPAPEAELAGAAGSGAESAVQSMQFMSMDQSLATQAASAGINATKELFAKKVKKIKVHLESGLHILLRDNKKAR
jgi:hypothetical protein